MDTMFPDYDAYPQLLNAVSCMQTTARRGDLIYYPPDYWHQTLNIESPSVSLSGTVIIENGWKEFLEVVERDCTGDKTSFNFGPFLCERLLGECSLRSQIFSRVDAESSNQAEL